jgi:hypothetical protein
MEEVIGKLISISFRMNISKIQNGGQIEKHPVKFSRDDWMS